MTRDPLAFLGQQALAFARTYIQVTEALQAQGVPEPVARLEARSAAVTMVLYKEQAGGEACPLCGKG